MIKRFEVEGSKEDFVDKKSIEGSDCFIAIMTKNWRRKRNIE